MKHAFARILALGGVFAALGAVPRAMAQAPDSVVITSPVDGSAIVGAGQTVVIQGSVTRADAGGFYVYVIGWSTGFVPNPVLTLANDGHAPIVDGVIATWNTADVPADRYLVVVSTDTASAVTSVLVDPLLRPGWPRIFSTHVNGYPSFAIGDHVTAADLDADGSNELLFALRGKVHVLGSDGNERPGWPRDLTLGTEGDPFQRGPAAGDVDGDGRLEVVAADQTGTVYVWSADGTLLPGWPRLGTWGRPSVSVDDLDGDGRAEIVVASQAVVVFGFDGSTRPGWPQTVGFGPLRPPAIGDVTGDGVKDIVVRDHGNAFVVLSPSGFIEATWMVPDVPSNGLDTSYPVLGDLDGDGVLDVVTGTNLGQVFAWRGNGAVLSGWPQQVSFARVNTPAIGDVDGDGLPEVVAGTERDASGTSRLYVWTRSGSLLPGWPVGVAPGGGPQYFGYGAPALADLDGDGKADVIVSGERTVAGAGFGLEAFRFDTANVAGFPRPTANLGPLASNSPAVADLDGDGLLEMAWFDMDGRLFVWNLPALATGTAPWPMFRADAGHTGRATAADTAGVAVSANPGGPYSGFKRQPIVFDGSASTMSGGGVLDRYEWNFGDGASEAGSAFAQHGYETSGVFTLTLVVGAGPVSSAPATTTVTIANRPPIANPGPPRSGTNTAPISFDASGSLDPDLDPLTYSWDFGDGTTGSGPVVTHQYVAGVYVATLTVSDGEAAATATVPVGIADLIPPAPITTLSAALLGPAPLSCHGSPRATTASQARR